MESDFEVAKRRLAANLVRLRGAQRWSQHEAAEAAGIDLKHLQKLEYAALNPSLRTLVSVASAFRVSVGRLLRPAANVPRRPPGRPPNRRRPASAPP